MHCLYDVLQSKKSIRTSKGPLVSPLLACQHCKHSYYCIKGSLSIVIHELCHQLEKSDIIIYHDSQECQHMNPVPLSATVLILLTDPFSSMCYCSLCLKKTLFPYFSLLSFGWMFRGLLPFECTGEVKQCCIVNHCNLPAVFQLML